MPRKTAGVRREPHTVATMADRDIISPTTRPPMRARGSSSGVLPQSLSQSPSAGRGGQPRTESPASARASPSAPLNRSVMSAAEAVSCSCRARCTMIARKSVVSHFATCPVRGHALVIGHALHCSVALMITDKHRVSDPEAGVRMNACMSECV